MTSLSVVKNIVNLYALSIEQKWLLHWICCSKTKITRMLEKSLAGSKFSVMSFT